MNRPTNNVPAANTADDASNQPTNALAVPGQQAGTIATAFDDAFEQVERHNVDLSAKGGSQIYLALCGSGTIVLKNQPDREFNIVYFRAHPVEFTDEVTGEVTSGIRMAFIDKDGKAYSTTAAGCWRIVAAHYKQQGKQGKFNPPLTVNLVRGGPANRQYLAFNVPLDPKLI